MKTLVITFLIACLFITSGCRSTDTAGGHLVILKAIYGDNPTNSIDVTEEIRLLAKSGSIHLHPQWGLGVDPAYGKIKRITVAYRYKGQIEVATFDQHQEFEIPALP